MNTVCKRLLTFIIGVPLVLAFVFLDIYNHLPFNVLVIAFSFLSANEFYTISSSKYKLFPRWILVIFTTLIPLVAYVFSLNCFSFDSVLWFFVFETLILMGIETFTSKTFEESLTKNAISFLILFYCGFLISFVVKFTTLKNSKYILGLFFILVFLCDSAAWLFGILFGKNNRGFIAASPNKSIIGFLGGIAGSIVFGCIYKYIFPEIFEGSYLKMIILALFTALASIVGDLIESVYKRSLGVKDSGRLIPGRGGVLDSIDSIIIAAPVFYIGIYFLYNFS